MSAYSNFGRASGPWTFCRCGSGFGVAASAGHAPDRLKPPPTRRFWKIEPPHELLERYAKEGEKLVSADKKDFDGKSYKAIGENLVSSKIITPKEGDKIHRPLIRHDGDKLTRLLMKIYFS